VLTVTLLPTRSLRLCIKASHVSRLIQRGIPTITWVSVQTVRQRWTRFQRRGNCSDTLPP